MLKAGDNQLSVIIYGTLKNTLGPHHLNLPAGQAWPGSFNGGRKVDNQVDRSIMSGIMDQAGDIIISRIENKN